MSPSSRSRSVEQGDTYGGRRVRSTPRVSPGYPQGIPGKSSGNPRQILGKTFGWRFFESGFNRYFTWLLGFLPKKSQSGDCSTEVVLSLLSLLLFRPVPSFLLYLLFSLFFVFSLLQVWQAGVSVNMFAWRKQVKNIEESHASIDLDEFASKITGIQKGERVMSFFGHLRKQYLFL